MNSASTRVVSLVCVLSSMACGKKDDRSRPADEQPTRRTAEMRSKQLESQVRLKVAGFRHLRGFATPATNQGNVWYRGEKPNAHGYVPAAEVVFGRCHRCRKMDLSLWKAEMKKTDSWRSTPLLHTRDPGFVFELEEMKVGDFKCITIRRQGLVRHGKETLALHDLTCRANDGVNYLKVVVKAHAMRKKTPPGTRQEQEKRFNKNELRAAAWQLFHKFAREVF